MLDLQHPSRDLDFDLGADLSVDRWACQVTRRFDGELKQFPSLGV
jgi:hypothetical protein